MRNEYPLLFKDIEESPTVMFGNYPYRVLKIGNGIPYINSMLLREIIDGLMKICDFKVNRIVCPEPMGVYLGAVLSYLKGVKVTFLRRLRFGLPNEVEIRQTTNYSETALYLYGLIKDEEVAVVDDVISSGATMISIIDSLKKHGANVKEAAVVVARGDGIENVKRRTCVEVKYLARFNVTEDGKAHLEYHHQS